MITTTPLITLTTDFGIKDHFVGAVKGAIYSELVNATIVDITHQISPFNITETAYILKNACQNFPDNTIHIIGVDSEISADNKHLVFVIENQYFICADNGAISMIAATTQPTKIIEIKTEGYTESSFPVLDVFVKVASKIASGIDLDTIGSEITSYKKITEVKPKVNEQKDIIIGGVIYIDNYGNVVTNISKKTVETISKGRNFTITARRHKFETIYCKYNQIIEHIVPDKRSLYDGEKLAVFNAAGFLEIAMYRSNLNTVGGASTLLGLAYRDTVTIEFKTIENPDFTPIH